MKYSSSANRINTALRKLRRQERELQIAIARVRDQQENTIKTDITELQETVSGDKPIGDNNG